MLQLSSSIITYQFPPLEAAQISCLQEQSTPCRQGPHSTRSSAVPVNKHKGCQVNNTQSTVVISMQHQARSDTSRA